MKYIFIAALCFGCQLAQGQNNDIFNGGNADGWVVSNYLQSSANIYTGGAQDGWHYASFSQAANQLYNGGANDGWHYSSYAQAGNDIFQGGAGDGWSDVYYPMGTLPVTWFAFKAEKRGEKALLSWQTISEVNTSVYQVERKALNQKDFSAIGKVEAVGTSAVWQSYSFTDQQPGKGMNHYRIKQVDKDGRFSYSPVQLLDFSKQGSAINLYPVPVSETLHVVLPGTNNQEKITLSILDAAGKVVMQRQFTGGSNVLTVNVAGLPAGVYYAQVHTGKEVISAKFIRQ